MGFHDRQACCWNIILALEGLVVDVMCLSAASDQQHKSTGRNWGEQIYSVSKRTKSLSFNR